MKLRYCIVAFAVLACAHTLRAQNPVVPREFGGTQTEDSLQVKASSTAQPPATGVISAGFDAEQAFPDSKASIDTMTYKPSIEKYNPDTFSATQEPFHTNMIRDVSHSGTIASWNGFNLVGSGRYQEHPFLMTSRNAQLGISKSWGALSVYAGASATNYGYMPLGSMYQFGGTAIVSYAFNARVSMTGFGQFYNINPYYNMAPSPFISTTTVGGFMTFMGDRVGIDLGAQRYINPMNGKWEMAPIVTPKVKLWDSVTIEVPVGGAIKSGVDHMNRRKNGPPPPPPPGRR